MNNVILLIGVPASGKTTFIADNEVAISQTYKVDCMLSSDAVIEEVAACRELTYSEVFRDTIEAAQKYVESLISIRSLQQRSFILDQTNLTNKSRKRKLGFLIHPNNYNKIAVVFSIPAKEELVIRLSSREGKIIPEHVLEAMIKQFEYPTLEEGFNAIYTAEEFIKTLKIPEEPKFGEMKFA